MGDVLFLFFNGGTKYTACACIRTNVGPFGLRFTYRTFPTPATAFLAKLSTLPFLLFLGWVALVATTLAATTSRSSVREVKEMRFETRLDSSFDGVNDSLGVDGFKTQVQPQYACCVELFSNAGCIGKCRTEC